MTNYCINTKQIELIKFMDLAWLEHIFYTRLLLISVTENLTDLEKIKTRLLENPKDIAKIFQRYYENSAAQLIENLLTEHLIICYNLIVSLKNKNQKVADDLNKKWYKNADYMVDEFSRLNPFFLKKELRQLLYNHLNLTDDEVTARLNGNYTADIKTYDMLQEETLKMSEFFANGIFMQFPHLF